jgi:hypothetical protein
MFLFLFLFLFLSEANFSDIILSIYRVHMERLQLGFRVDIWIPFDGSNGRS